jgi:hypothetical protein
MNGCGLAAIFQPRNGIYITNYADKEIFIDAGFVKPPMSYRPGFIF